jgi:hypothetical protein
MDKNQLEITELSLPFELPDTDEARDWMMELDFVDIYEGSLAELGALAEEAPSESARFWLQGWIACRQSRENLASVYQEAA